MGKRIKGVDNYQKEFLTQMMQINESVLTNSRWRFGSLK